MLKKKTDAFYTKERDIYYNSLLNKNKIDIYSIKTELPEVLKDFQLFVSTYFKHYTTDSNGIEIKLGKFHLELIEELKQDKVEILAEFSRGFAKAQSLNSKILTPYGWKVLKDISVGDIIIGRDGKNKVVEGLSPITEMDFYKVSTRDGRNTLCNLDHLWTVQHYSHGKLKTIPLSKIIKDYKKDKLDKRDGIIRDEYNYYLPTVSPIEFEYKELPIDPYVFGCWLGDGDTMGGSFTSNDIEIIKNIEERGYIVSKHKANYRYGIKGLQKQLRLNGFLGHKYIPNEYLFSSIQQREELLQGLIDTDGSINKDGHIATYTTIKKELMDNVIALIRSLGGTCTLMEGWNKCNGKLFHHYRITFRLPGDIIPAKLSRKRNLWKGSLKTKAAITNIEYHSTGLGRCLKVQDEHYITDDYMVTHNTTVFSLFAAVYFMLRKDINLALLVSSTKDAAVKQLINIQVEFETNEKLIKDFGPFVKDGSWSKGEFVVDNYDCKFTCAGKGQSIRGLRYKSHRPDFIIVDDIDTDKDSRNKELVSQHYDWLMQSVLGAMEITKYKFLFVGNRFSHNMVLNEFAKVDGIKHIKVNALDENGNSNWKERYSTEDLQRIESKIGTIRFQREYMNFPITVGSIFKEEWIQFKECLPFSKYEYIVAYLDPSFKKDGDFKSIVTLGFTKGEYHILDIYVRRQTMNNVIEYLYNLNDKLLKAPYSMYYEANFAQDLHQKEFDEIALKKGFRLPIIQDKEKKDNKEARIESMSVVFENRNIFFSHLLKGTLDFEETKNELLSFPTLINDDAIDSLQSSYVKLNLAIRKMKFIPEQGERDKRNWM